MRGLRLRNKLLLGATAIGVIMTLVFMAAVSWVTRQQYLDQSSALLNNASTIIENDLTNRKAALQAASNQLASQHNLGSTIWYLSQYAQSDINREILLTTYQQLAKDTHEIGQLADLSRITIYDASGKLVSFTSFEATNEQVGFVERYPSPVVQIAQLKLGDELNRDNLHTSTSTPGINLEFGAKLPQQSDVHYAIVDGMMALECDAPIMGVSFDLSTGKRQISQLGLVRTVQVLDHTFADRLSHLTDISINIFTENGFNSGDMSNYSKPDWTGIAPKKGSSTFNEITIDGEHFYQSLIPLYTGNQLVGTIAALHSAKTVQKNTRAMLQTLLLIAAGVLLLVLPFAWYLANSISHPITVLSKIFRRVASDRQSLALNHEIGQLKNTPQHDDELGDLTQSFIEMDNAVNLNITRIIELNSSLEEKIDQRTSELRLANEELTKLVTQDSLTGLPNRNLVMDRLGRALVFAKRDHTHVALMFIDLDQFKPVNDTFGHDIGDSLLKEVATRIKRCLRESDTVARIGGDEFIVLLPIIEAENDAREVAEKIRSSLCQPFGIADHMLSISSSIGIAIYPQHGSEADQLLKHADMAMYFAKGNGRNTVSVFQPET